MAAMTSGENRQYIEIGLLAFTFLSNKFLFKNACVGIRQGYKRPIDRDRCCACGK